MERYICFIIAILRNVDSASGSSYVVGVKSYPDHVNCDLIEDDEDRGDCYDENYRGLSSIPWWSWLVLAIILLVILIVILRMICIWHLMGDKMKERKERRRRKRSQMMQGCNGWSKHDRSESSDRHEYRHHKQNGARSKRHESPKQNGHSKKQMIADNVQNADGQHHPGQPLLQQDTHPQAGIPQEYHEYQYGAHAHRPYPYPGHEEYPYPAMEMTELRTGQTPIYHHQAQDYAQSHLGAVGGVGYAHQVPPPPPPPALPPTWPPQHQYHVYHHVEDDIGHRHPHVVQQQDQCECQHLEPGGPAAQYYQQATEAPSPRQNHSHSEATLRTPTTKEQEDNKKAQPYAQYRKPDRSSVYV